MKTAFCSLDTTSSIRRKFSRSFLVKTKWIDEFTHDHKLLMTSKFNTGRAQILSHEIEKGKGMGRQWRRGCPRVHSMPRALGTLTRNNKIWNIWGGMISKHWIHNFTCKLDRPQEVFWQECMYRCGQHLPQNASSTKCACALWNHNYIMSCSSWCLGNSAKCPN